MCVISTPTFFLFTLPHQIKTIITLLLYNHVSYLHLSLSLSIERAGLLTFVVNFRTFGHDLNEIVSEYNRFCEGIALFLIV